LQPRAHRPEQLVRQLCGDHVVDADQHLRQRNQQPEVRGAHRLIQPQDAHAAEHHQVRDRELRP
jgi:hypothetical protein